MATKGAEGSDFSDDLTGLLTAGIPGCETKGKHKTGLLAHLICPNTIDRELLSYCRPCSWTTGYLIFNIPALGAL